MNFVANLLRSRQHDPTLLWQPFTDEDVVRVWNGGYPTRFADPFEQAVRTPWLPDDLGTSPGDREGPDDGLDARPARRAPPDRRPAPGRGRWGDEIQYGWRTRSR